MVCREVSRLVYRSRVEMVDDTGRVVIRSSVDVTEPANTAPSYFMEDARLIGPPVEVLIGDKIGAMHPLDGPDNAIVVNVFSVEGAALKSACSRVRICLLKLIRIIFAGISMIF